MQVLADRILVRPIFDEVKSSLILLDDTKKKVPIKGVVLEVGDGFKDQNMVVNKGDIVVFGKSSGYEIELEGEKVVMLKMQDIIATLDEDILITIK